MATIPTSIAGITSGADQSVNNAVTGAVGSINSIGASLLTNSAGDRLMRNQAPSREQAMGNAMVQNSDWIRQSFIVGMSGRDSSLIALEDQDVLNRRFSSADLKYTDSSLGGNTVINPPPQFTRYADIRSPGIHPEARDSRVTLTTPKSAASLGMGRYYSEAIDDSKQQLHLRFGVASYNSLTQFFSGFYSGDLAAAARTGRLTDSALSSFFSFAGNLVGLAIAPLFLIPLAVLLAGDAAKFIANVPGSKFYYLKPTMPMYWNAVTSLVNQMAVASGLSNYVTTTQAETVLKNTPEAGTLEKNAVMNMVGRFLPRGLINESGSIDVYAMATRANRLNIAYENLLSKAFDDAAKVKGDYYDTVRNFVELSRTTLMDTGPKMLEQYIYEWITGADSYNRAKDTDAVEQDFRLDSGSTDPEAKTYKSDGSYEPPGGAISDFFSYLSANFNDGSEFASFRVDYTGPVSESFSNSTAESSLASKINSTSSSAREIRMNLADGNVGGGIGEAVGAVKSFLGGVAEVIHIDGIAALAGNAFIDIPKHWDSSMSSLPKSTYTMTLISPYGNPVSQLFHIWVPLSMILAGALPLATGKQSHTSPFLVESHDRGRVMVRTGIIDQLTITRGTSNLGFTSEGRALAVEVSFSILDLSSVLAMPIQPGFSVSSALGNLFDSDNPFTDYLMSLSAMKLSDTIYRVPMLKYQINRVAADLDSYFSASHFASYVASLPGVNMLSAIAKGSHLK